MSVSLISFGCAVCFGADPTAMTSKALVTAVSILGGVVVAVLAGIAWTAFVWSRRAKTLQTTE